LLKKWLREPLLHFLVIGTLLFVIYGLQNDGISDQSKRIVFTSADINRLALLWEKQRQRPPTQAELKGLIEQQIREQVLYREALAMGLDQNDAIVRRRLAQKVEFISADIAALAEPSEKNLADYLSTHSKQFEIPARIDFVQVYFSVEKRGAHLDQDAYRALAELRQTNSNTDISTMGDSSMLGLQFTQQSGFEVSRLFGKTFARELFILPVGSWQGPVVSGYGLHLLRIDKKAEARQPELAAVRKKVHNEWMSQQRRTVDKAFYQALRQQYEIIIEDSDLVNARLNNVTTSVR